MVDILLACYNGEKYLAQMIESIIKQTHIDWRLIIQDDCSSDKTAEIAAEFARNYPQKIFFFQRETPSCSSQNNFLSMLKFAKNEYIMFADQDDFWLENKVELTLAEMKRLEKNYGSTMPLLVHTDLIVADEDLQPLHQSFFSYQGLDKHANSLNKLLSQNNVTGCTMMLNRQLLLLVEKSEAILMHDWWFALIAAGMGKIGFVDTPTILYRQHGNNQLGAVNNRSIKYAAKVAKNRIKAKKRLSVTYTQANAFLDIYSDRLPKKSRTLVDMYVSIPNKNKLLRVYFIVRYNFTKQSMMTKIGQIIFC